MPATKQSPIDALNNQLATLQMAIDLLTIEQNKITDADPDNATWRDVANTAHAADAARAVIERFED